MTAAGVGTRTLRAMAWAYGGYVGGRLLVLAATAILARLLTPSDFGVVALALVFMTFLDSVKDLGLSQALVASGGDAVREAERAQTVFAWTVGIGALLTIAVAAFAPLAATLFGEHELRGIVPALGLNFFLGALGATHYALARKALDYRTRTKAELVEVVLRGAVSIALALAGMGAWSLVLGYLAGTTARVGVLWRLVPFRPRLRPSRRHLGELVRFGGALTVVDVGSAIEQNIDYLFVGRVLGAAALGAYTIAFRLPTLLIMNLAIVAGDVLFPAYAVLDRARLRDGFLLALRYTALLVFPIGAALAILGQPVILALFGGQWHASIDVLRVVAGYAVCYTLSIPAGTVYKVLGRAWILVATTVPYLATLSVLLVLFSGRGILAVAICVAGLQALGMLVNLAIAGRMLRVAYARIARALAGPALATAGMAVPLLVLERVLQSPWPAVLAGGAVALVAYAALVWRLEPEALLRLRDTAFPRLGSVRAP